MENRDEKVFPLALIITIHSFKVSSSRPAFVDKQVG